MPLATDSKAVIREYVAALQAGDVEAVRGLFAEDATWTLHAGASPSRARSRAATGSSASSWPTALEHYEPGSIQLEITGMTAEDDRVVLQWTSRARTADGRPYENGCIGVRGPARRRIVAVREYMDTLYARDTAFAAPP